MSLRRLTPPTHLLRTFSAVLRFGGITPAAQALHLTQSAVSKQVQELERWVGLPLFERSRKRLTPTPAAARYEASVRATLSQLEAATLELIASDEGGGALHLAAAPAFGARWLIPRLPAFQQAHPQVMLHFAPYATGEEGLRPGVDAALLFGDGHWPGTRTHYLAGRQLALIAPRQGPESAIAHPRDVARCTRLQHVSVPEAWPRWAQAHQQTHWDAMAGPQFDQFQTMIRAVIAGMGVALVPLCLVGEELAAGLVSQPLGPAGGCEIERGYWLAYPESQSHLGTLALLRDWLLTQAERA